MFNGLFVRKFGYKAEPTVDYDTLRTRFIALENLKDTPMEKTLAREIGEQLIAFANSTTQKET